MTDEWDTFEYPPGANKWDNTEQGDPGPAPDVTEPSQFAATLIRRSKLKTLPRVEPLVDGVLSRHASVTMVGAQTLGKTFVGLSLACSIATGQAWLGHKVRHRSPVLYVVGEGAYGLDARVSAWEQAWGVEVDDDLTFSVKPDSLMNLRTWREMAEQARDMRAQVVELDTFSSLAPDADETRDAAVIMRRLSDLATAIDGTSMLIHHPGWSNDSRTRGGYQLEANADEVLLLTGDSGSEYIDMKRKKVKEGPDGIVYRLRRRPAFGSCVIESASEAERVAEQANGAGTAHAAAFVAFGAETFTRVDLRDTLIERLDVHKTVAYEHIKQLKADGLVIHHSGKEGGQAERFTVVPPT